MRQQALAARAANAVRWADKPGCQELLAECREYAAHGYSRTTAAACLGYSRAHFTRHVLPRIDPEHTIPWPSRGATGGAARQEAGLMAATRNTHPESVRIEAISRVLAGGCPAGIAREFGASGDTVRRWVRDHHEAMPDPIDRFLARPAPAEVA